MEKGWTQKLIALRARFIRGVEERRLSSAQGILSLSRFKKMKVFGQAFFKRLVGSKGKALGRTPQSAKHSMILKTQEGRPNSVWP